MKEAFLTGFAYALPVALLLGVANRVRTGGKRLLSPTSPFYPSPKYMPALCSSGKRDMSKVKLIVLHSTEGPSAMSAVNEFRNNDQGSTQIIAGDDGVFRMLDDDVVPCGAEGANSQGLHIEAAGMTAWTKAQWLAHIPTLYAVAANLRAWSDLYDIPLHYLSVAELKAGQPGVTTHNDVRLAFGEATHFDPGPGFPIDDVLRLARMM